MLRGVASLLCQPTAIETTWTDAARNNGWRPGHQCERRHRRRRVGPLQLRVEVSTVNVTGARPRVPEAGTSTDEGEKPVTHSWPPKRRPCTEGARPERQREPCDTGDDQSRIAAPHDCLLPSSGRRQHTAATSQRADRTILTSSGIDRRRAIAGREKEQSIHADESRTRLPGKGTSRRIQRRTSRQRAPFVADDFEPGEGRPTRGNRLDLRRQVDDEPLHFPDPCHSGRIAPRHDGGGRGLHRFTRHLILD